MGIITAAAGPAQYLIKCTFVEVFYRHQIICQLIKIIEVDVDFKIKAFDEDD